MNPWEIDVESGTNQQGAGPRLDYHDKVVVLDVNRLNESPKMALKNEIPADSVFEDTMNFKLALNDILSFSHNNDEGIPGLGNESTAQPSDSADMQFNMASGNSSALLSNAEDSVYTPYI